MWDVHITDSLKIKTREKREKGIRRRVLASTVMTKKWMGFLGLDQNITEVVS